MEENGDYLLSLSSPEAGPEVRIQVQILLILKGCLETLAGGWEARLGREGP